MLDSRAQHLLKALIERYIADGSPVGSRVLSRQSGLELSPATIRNVMADLEEMGFIASPHTSAGRIPTAKGYRFFVDTLLVVQPLGEGEISELQDHLSADRPQGLVSNAAQLLSELTRFAGVVATARRREPSFRQIEFLRLSERRVLFRHTLRTSMITFVSLFGLDFGALVAGGVLLTEVVFGIHGVGFLTYQSLTNLDLPVIMATVVYGAFFIVLANTLVDIAYAWLDPRIRPA